jgi:hypothetical protein
MKSKTLFAPMAYSLYEKNQTLPVKFERLLDKCPLKDKVDGKSVAVKMHVGDGVGYSTIPPIFVRSLVEKLKSWGAKPFLTDHNVLGREPAKRGYTDAILGAPIVDVCGLLDQYYYEKKVDFNNLQDVDIAGYINDADFMIDFSHVKGHGTCGFGGACKNIAMGCVTQRTRSQIHSLEGGLDWDESKCIHCDKCLESCNHHANSFDDEGKYNIFFHHCTYCQHCVKVCPTNAIKMTANKYEDFQKGMALTTKTVLDSFEEGHVYYINVLTQITALCDCWGMTTPSLVPDIGIIASDDIVAIERASLDKIKIENLIKQGVPKGRDLDGEGHLFERLHGKNPYVQLDELEKLGLGSQEYEEEVIR